MKILNTNTSKNSREHGLQKISKLETNPIEQRKKEKNLVKQVTIRAIICIILTNILTYMTFSSPHGEQMSYSLRPNEIIIKVALINNSESSTKTVNLYNKNDIAVITNAQILEQLETTLDLDDRSAHFHLVKISRNQMENIIKNKSQILYAYPFTKELRNKQYSGGPYEINM